MAHVDGSDESTTTPVMNWHPLVWFLPFALLIDGLVFYIGRLIWRAVT